ncbi:MAG: glucose-6-phosphate isomerase [Oscillospiraceae bacterium]|nr:glucose-6-phosphate isomerase [Oscillospiraceae bacterium]
MLKLDLSKLEGVISQEQISAMAPEVEAAHAKLYDPAAPGSDFVGWVRLPENYDKEEFARIQKAAAKIREDSQVLVVVGIGGSYLGARAALEVFPSNGPEICFVGCSLSPNELETVIRKLDDRSWSINVISKSGGTTEPAVAFRVFRELLVKQYGEEANKRIYATTDKARGALKTLADSNGWETFVVPDDVGGRFSVLSAVGLLPIAVGGTDIDELMSGARDAMNAFDQRDMSNPVWQYVAARNLLYRQGKKIELFCSYEPSYSFVGEWLKQLFGESEGKDGKGIFPASAQFTTDLHSLGQYIQDGERHLFETVIYVDDTGCDIAIPYSDDNGDNLNYLAGKPLSFVREMAFQGTLAAHQDGGAPSMVLRLDKMNVHALGELLYFFELSCGISGHVLGVNPFNQPGVEAYKKNMFALLGKP